MNRPYITAITRVRTVNIGNEALSSELLKQLDLIATGNGSKVVVLERAPRHLAQFNQRALAGNPSRALKELDRWVQRLIKEPPAGNPLPPLAAIVLVFKAAPPQRMLWFKEKLQLRKWAARWGLYASEFRQRLGIFARSSWVLLNPAGELNPQSIDPPLRMLSELRAAKALGAKIGVINFSFEIPDGELLPAFAHLFNDCDLIAVRDRLSLDVLLKIGVEPEIMRLIPDLAFMTEPESPEVGQHLAKSFGIESGTVAVVVNGRVGTSNVESWASIVRYLQEAGHPVIILSNEMSSDLVFVRSLAKATGAKLIEQQVSYAQYSALLRELRLVVSNRLHTAVLSMVAGTPAVAVEPIARRIKGVMEDMDYPFFVPCVGVSGWEEKTVEVVENMLACENDYRNNLPLLVKATRNRIMTAYSQILSDVDNAN